MTPPAPRSRLAHLDLLFVRPAPAAPRSRRISATFALVALTTLAAALLRLESLAAQSFSPGETAYVLAARASAWNPHGLLLAALSSSFGAGDAVLRLPSALAGVASVPLLYALVRHLARREVALAFAALLAFAPLHVAASQDARPFTIALAAGLGAVLLAARAASPSSIARCAARAVELRRSRRALVLACCAAAVPLLAAAVASATWHPAKSDWRAAVSSLEKRVQPEDLLIFDRAASEAAYLRYALRADDRLALDSASRAGVAGALSGRHRAWLVVSDVEREAAARGKLPAGWREADRLYARGVQAVLLERGEATAKLARAQGRK